LNDKKVLNLDFFLYFSNNKKRIIQETLFTIESNYCNNPVELLN